MIRPWELQLTIDPSAGKAVYLQIADSIIDAVRSGQLTGGTALPGSRKLAAGLGVNRNTLVRALDLLLSEGWITSRERSGMFVAHDLPLGAQRKGAVQAAPAMKLTAPGPEIVFDDGFPDSRIAPIKELSRAYRQLLERNGRWHLLGYKPESGDDAFRQAVMQMLNIKRGMRLSAEQLFITRGSQMAMYLSAHCLLRKGDTVAIENPGYRPAWDVFRMAGAALMPVDVDADGLVTDQLKAALKKGVRIRAVYTTPHHQFPTTVTMSLQRRLELVELSNKHGFTIIEDDYDHEFHFGQRPLLPVCSHERAEHYIYIGSMSKVVAPALRIGYLASTAQFVSRVGELRKLIDVQGDTIMEQAVLQLINEGEIRRHLKRATAFYKKKRDRFEQMIIDRLGEKISCTRPEGGLAFWLRPKAAGDFDRLEQRLLKQGIRIVPPAIFSYEEAVTGLRLGYGSLPEEQLEQGVTALAKCLAQR